MTKSLRQVVFLIMAGGVVIIASVVMFPALAQTSGSPSGASNFEQSGSTAAPARHTSGGKGLVGPAQHPEHVANPQNFLQSGAHAQARQRQQKKTTGMGGSAAPPGDEGSPNYVQSGNPQVK